jgi:hypothetical protein
MLLCFPSTLKSGAPAWLLPGHFHKTQVILWCHIRLKRDQQILIPEGPGAVEIRQTLCVGSWGISQRQEGDVLSSIPDAEPRARVSLT